MRLELRYARPDIVARGASPGAVRQDGLFWAYSFAKASTSSTYQVAWL